MDGVLVMAYGTPKGLDDVEAYYTDIRHGRPPSPEQLDELTARYRAIGGVSPLLQITESQAKGIEERLGIKTYVGQKHAAPFIPDAIARLKADGINRAIGLVLAPHYSAMSIGDYEKRAARAAEENGWSGRLEMIRSWHVEPGYIDLLERFVKEALEQIGPEARPTTTVVFTAHSLPAAIVRTGDPYPEQLQQTAAAVSERLSLDRWRTGWQSAGCTKDPWLGPDVLEILAEVASSGGRGVVVCPCGFVADHLEVLYDLDIEAKERATELGIEFARTRSPNDDPAFLDTLAGVVERALNA